MKELLLSMPCHKATGLDGIGARVLKVAAMHLIVPGSFNKSLH